MANVPDSLWQKLGIERPGLSKAMNLEFTRTMASDNDVRIAYLAGRITPEEVRKLQAAIRERTGRYFREQGYD